MASTFLILVGSFTPLLSTLQLDVSTFPARLTLLSQTTAGTTPSWVQAHPLNSSIIYTTDEVLENGAVNSFTLDMQTGQVTLVDTIATQGGGPTHIGIGGEDGTQLTAANFFGGSAFFVDLQQDLLTFQRPGQLLTFNPNADSRAHQAVPNGDEILIADLGLDTIHRIRRDEEGVFVNEGQIPQLEGSGPRHLVVDGERLFTLHELDNTLTEQTLPSIDNLNLPRLVTSLSIVPPDTQAGAQLGAGELLFAPTPDQPLLYASNRNDPNVNGDAIAIFTTRPRLQFKTQIRTGLQHLRAVALGGPDNKYLVVGGLNGGGIKVYERVAERDGFLREIASLEEGVVDQPTSFVVVQQTPNGAGGAGTGTATGTRTLSGTGAAQATESNSSASRRRRLLFWDL